jgi:hypothetical protein
MLKSKRRAKSILWTPPSPQHVEIREKSGGPEARESAQRANDMTALTDFSGSWFSIGVDISAAWCVVFDSLFQSPVEEHAGFSRFCGYSPEHMSLPLLCAVGCCASTQKFSRRVS